MNATKLKPETRLKYISQHARRQALKVLMDSKGCLPEGWIIHVAVGWGLICYDENRKVVFDDLTGPPSRLPRGVRPFLEACTYFYGVFGAGNEQLTSTPKERTAHTKGRAR